MRAATKYFNTTVMEAAKVDLSHPHSYARAKASKHVPVVISVMKNELALLPDFLAHYRELGVERFVIIDNGSIDGSIDYCIAQGDITLHVVHRKFSWPQKQGWVSRVIAELGYDRWYVYVDGDERIVFDGVPERGLVDLSGWADSVGLCRVRGMLIDMYADGPIVGYNWDGQKRLTEAFPNFDSNGYDEFRFEMIMSRRGGPRRRVMFNSPSELGPEMTKYPLFKLRPGDVMDNPHHISPKRENFFSDCLIGILHYKFLPGFIKKVNKAIQEQNYFDGSAEYKRYLAALRDDPELKLTYAGTRQFDGSTSLISNGLIASVDWLNPKMHSLDLARRKARQQALEEAALRHV